MAKVRLLDPNDSKRRLDRYELIGELASGGMATVFLGRLGGVGGFQRFVAIKRLHPHLASEEEFIEMFLDEARLAAGIHHPHVVPILEVGESDSGYYLVMEYIEGDTLARLMARALARAQPIPRSVLIRIVLDTLAGLHAAHELLDTQGNPVNLVHRDVSPQNVLVGVDGCSRITDFGVAHAASRLQNTRADRLKGKLAYMSPEQARSGEIDQRADVFAMGIILWEVLAARRLFKGESEAVTLQRVTVEPIPRLSSVVQGLHPALDQVCSRALERDRDLRYRTAADMAEGLERAARAAASASATDLGVASPREVAAYVQGALGEDIAAQRESVRAWLAHSEPSLPRLGAVKPVEMPRPPGYDVTMKMPLDRALATAAASLPRPPQIPPAPQALVPMGPQAAVPLGVGGAAGDAHAATPLPSPGRARGATVGSTPNVREALGIGASSPLLTPDGASIDEVPVEPTDDDDEEHETLLMDREAAVELMRQKAFSAKPLSTPPPPAPRIQPPPALNLGNGVLTAAGPPAASRTPHPAPVSAPFSDGTPSKSIESFMVPAPPPPSRTPQFVALAVALLIGGGGLLAWWELHADAGPTEATPRTATTPTPPTAVVAAPPRAADDAGAHPQTTAATATNAPISLSSLPPSQAGDAPSVAPRLWGRIPRGKATATATVAPVAPPPATARPVAPPPPEPPPDLPKTPDDMLNPYKPPQ